MDKSTTLKKRKNTPLNVRCEEYCLREKKDVSRRVCRCRLFVFDHEKTRNETFDVSIIFRTKTHHRKHHATKHFDSFTKDDDDDDDGVFVEEEFLLRLIPRALSF